MDWLKRLVERNDTLGGRAFDLVIQSLIVISLVTFSIETLPNLSTQTRYWLYVIEVVTVALFTVEFLVRILVTDRKLNVVFSFFGLIDLMASTPTSPKATLPRSAN